MEAYRPPLVTGLFEARPAFTPILREYPLAQSAAADIRPAIAGGSVVLEAYLRDQLRDSEHEHDRKRYWAIPLYLQHLFWQIAQWPGGFTGHPDNYDRLVSAALRADEVIFITLNYDDLLDRRLFIYDPLRSMESYISDVRNWSLIKLHGSVDWGRRVDGVDVLENDPFLANTFASLGELIDLSKGIVLRQHADLRGKRLDESGVSAYYPALSAPLGEKDELVCPPNHLAHLTERLGDWDSPDVLVVGYSGLDEEVLNMLREPARPIRSLVVVNGTEGAGAAAARQIKAAVSVLSPPEGDGVTCVDSGFDKFVRSGNLDSYIETIRAAADRRSRRPGSPPGSSLAAE
jgi:hypothetical protein